MGIEVTTRERNFQSDLQANVNKRRKRRMTMVHETRQAGRHSFLACAILPSMCIKTHIRSEAHSLPCLNLGVEYDVGKGKFVQPRTLEHSAQSHVDGEQ